jgi:hypothetical protein
LFAKHQKNENNDDDTVKMMIIIKIIIKMVPSGGTLRVLGGGEGAESIGSILYAAAPVRRLEAVTETFAAATGVRTYFRPLPDTFAKVVKTSINTVTEL